MDGSGDGFKGGRGILNKVGCSNFDRWAKDGLKAGFKVDVDSTMVGWGKGGGAIFKEGFVLGLSGWGEMGCFVWSNTCVPVCVKLSVLLQERSSIGQDCTSCGQVTNGHGSDWGYGPRIPATCLASFCDSEILSESCRRQSSMDT